MQHFDVTLLQKDSGSLLKSAQNAPVLLCEQGQPRYALMDADLFEELMFVRRTCLAQIAGEILRENAPAFEELSK